MDGPSPKVGGETVWHDEIRRHPASTEGFRRGRGAAAPYRARVSRRARCAAVAGVEALEDRRLLSVSLVSANPLGQAGLTGIVSNDADISDDGRYVVFT